VPCHDKDCGNNMTMSTITTSLYLDKARGTTHKSMGKGNRGRSRREEGGRKRQLFGCFDTTPFAFTHLRPGS
jgi:hypothetical protein